MRSQKRRELVARGKNVMEAGLEFKSGAVFEENGFEDFGGLGM
jgi:hypothetical protein